MLMLPWYVELSPRVCQSHVVNTEARNALWKAVKQAAKRAVLFVVLFFQLSGRGTVLGARWDNER